MSDEQRRMDGLTLCHRLSSGVRMVHDLEWDSANR